MGPVYFFGFLPGRFGARLLSFKRGTHSFRAAGLILARVSNPGLRLSIIGSKVPPVSSTPTQIASSLPSLYDFFAPGGLLSRSSLPYEFRRGQLEMAKAVERALEENRHLIVEAGTGTGKTLAYLLPALRTGRRVIISTGTKNLQEQLFFKDIPFLESMLGPLRVTYMKGRANYLCRHKLVRSRAISPSSTASKRSTSFTRSPSGRRPPTPATAPRSTTCPRTAHSGPSSTLAPKPASAAPAPTSTTAS